MDTAVPTDASEWTVLYPAATQERQDSTDETLETLLTAMDRLDGRAVSDRVAALEALGTEIPRLVQLSSEQWDAKLADVEENVAELAEKAERATERYEQAQRALETLTHLAGRTRPRERDEGVPVSTNGRYDNEVARAETTRDAILRVMLRRPNRQWTAVTVHDDLERFGRPTERSNVQVTLRRLADAGQLRKAGRGVYHVVRENISLNGGGANGWMNEPANVEMLHGVAEEATDCLLSSHPGIAPREELIEEALHSVDTWIKNHGRSPEGEPHIRRLMKSRLDTVRKRIERSTAA